MLPYLQLYRLPSNPETVVLPSPQNIPPVSVSDGKGNCSAEGTGMRSRPNCFLDSQLTFYPVFPPTPQGTQCYHFLSLWGHQCINRVVFCLCSTPMSGFSFLGSSGSVITHPSVVQLLNSCCYCLLSHCLHLLSVCLFKMPLLSFKWSFRKEPRLLLGIQSAIFQMPSGF